MRIMFVCTGNSCRSPMADLYFNALCQRANRSDIAACSSGVCAWDGGLISRPAASVMEQLGIDSTKFRSRRFTSELAHQCDLLIAMSNSHRDAMSQIAPDQSVKIRLLLKEADVPDPFGGSSDHYMKIFETMKPALDELFRSVAG
ncbi:MAG: hypothetical protein LBM70_04915 [Victivallales bacterium]|jgi:protein-tyrosine-phosphatase|nr:hypothetical protein [Victivallales bacterium]